MLDVTMTIKELNELFGNLSKYCVSNKKGYIGVPDNTEGVMGQYNQKFYYYQHPCMPKNIFLQEIQTSDSYGSFNNADKTYSFVEGKSKTITVYEPI